MKFLPLLLLLLNAAHAWGQEVFAPPAQKRRAAATATATAPAIDGLLNEAAWRTAAPLNSFIQRDPVQGVPANFATEVRFLYDDKYLYLASVCHDTIGRRQLRAPDMRRDFFPPDHDYLLIAIDGFRDERNAMAFVVNPYGAQRDVLIFDDKLADADWDGLWRVRTQRGDSGWVAEIAIPWQTLRYAPKTATDADYAWGLNIGRMRRASYELSTWAPVPRALSPGRMDYAGLLTGLNPPPPGLNLRLQPYALASTDRAADGSRQTRLKTGGEAKWAITPETVLDLTVNTDFAQADVDRKVNNLSRFSVLFPERRQFFLENASLFSPGLFPKGGSLRILPFFSRAIGLAAGQPLPLDGGARLVHRSTARNFGGLAVRQRAADGQPANQFYVGRYSQNVGRQNNVGGLLTLRRHETGTEPGAPAYTSLTGAVDGFFRLGTKVTLSTMASVTGGSRAGLGGTAAYSELRYDANNLAVWWSEALVTKRYSPEVGFVGRRDVVSTTSGFYLIMRGKPWLPAWLRSFEPGTSNEFYHQASTGRLLESSNRFFFFDGILQNGGFLRLYTNRVFQRLDEPFRPLGLRIAPGSYTYYTHNLLLHSDASRRLSYTAQASTGGYYDGRLHALTLTAKLAPSPHFFLLPSYELNDFRRVGEAQTSRRVALYGVESRVALNPRVQLSGFYQLNSNDDSRVLNLRFAWEYRPLSFLYLVLNQQGHVSADRPVTERGLIGKVSYLKQF
jgi:hypothetical protein